MHRKAANEKDFIIEKGVLKKYRGNDIRVSIPNDVIVIDDGAFLSRSL